MAAGSAARPIAITYQSTGMYIYRPSNGESQLYFRTLSNNSIITPMIITDFGYVGIGVSSPQATLDIKGANSNIYPISRSIALTTAAKTRLSTISEPCAFWPAPANDFLLCYWRGSDTSNYSAAISGGAIPFTGQHPNMYIDSNYPITPSTLQDYVGLIVSSADEGYVPSKDDTITGSNAIWTTEALPKIKLSCKDKDKAVWGVITNHANDKIDTDGNYTLDTDPDWGTGLGNRIRVNGLGEGAIWITNLNGNLENGDYICSSVIPGYGRRQDDDILHNYTVAKITMSCLFELDQSNYRCEELQHEGQVYRKAYVGCTYHCS
jgi:hypothetical protein